MFLKSSPLIVLLHGWSVDSQNEQKWKHFSDVLQAKGFRTRFMGLPGLSTESDEVWTLKTFVEWLEAQLHSEKNVILLGHSFGGQLAIRYSALHPEQIQKLIVIDSSGLRPQDVRSRLKRAGFKIVAKIGKPLFKGDAWRKLLYKLAREKDYLTANSILRQTMRNVLDDEIGADLPMITCPTLIIWGAQDKMTPLSLAHRMQKGLKNSELHLIEDARHAPQLTHPAEVAQVIKEFLG